MEGLTLVVSSRCAFAEEIAVHHSPIVYAADARQAVKCVQNEFPCRAFFELNERSVECEKLAGELAMKGCVVRCIIAEYPAPGEVNVPIYVVRRPLIPCPFSPAELKVLRLLVKDKTNSEIARTLYLSENTTKTHLHRMYRKAGVNGRVGLAIKAVLSEWV